MSLLVLGHWPDHFFISSLPCLWYVWSKLMTNGYSLISLHSFHCSLLHQQNLPKLSRTPGPLTNRKHIQVEGTGGGVGRAQVSCVGLTTQLHAHQSFTDLIFPPLLFFPLLFFLFSFCLSCNVFYLFIFKKKKYISGGSFHPTHLYCEVKHNF